MDKLVMFVDDKDYEDGYDAGCPESIAYAITLPDNWTQDDIYVLYEEFRKIDDWAWRGDSFLDWLITKGHGEAVPILEVVCYPRFGEGEIQPRTPVVEFSGPPPPPMAGWGKPHQRSSDETDTP